MSRRDNELYVFEEFRLDPVRRVLQRDGETIAVTPKAFETLLALIEGRHRVMDKDELMRRVWPDAIVEEVGLAKHISALRKALGERTGEHRFIVTVPGRGYRFVAGVTVIPSATAPEASPDEWPVAPVIESAARPTAPAAGTGVLRSAGLLLALGGIVMVAILATGYVAGSMPFLMSVPSPTAAATNAPLTKMSAGALPRAIPSTAACWVSIGRIVAMPDAAGIPIATVRPNA